MKGNRSHGRTAAGALYGPVRCTVWVPGEPGSRAGRVLVRDAVTGLDSTICDATGALELPDGEGGWYAVWAARGDYEGSDGRYAIVRMADGTLVRTAILWGTQFAADGKRPDPWSFTPSRRTAPSDSREPEA